MSLGAWGDVEIRNEHQAAVAGRPDRMSLGLVGSTLLHILAAVLIVLVLPSVLQTPPETVPVVPIDLVQLADKTASPGRQPDKAEVPQEKAAETATLEPENPVPVPQTPPPAPEPVPPKPRDAPKSDPLGAITPQRKPDLPRLKEGPKSHPAAAVKPQPEAPVEDLQTRLRALAQAQQQQAQLPPNPRQQDGTGASNVTASTDSAVGREATYSVKDFIRAQIERHWIFDPSTLGSGDVLVSIHILLNRDGTVSRADIVDDPRYVNDPTYLALARSARNAAYLSSPVNLPPGRYDEVRDIVLTFDPRAALR